MNKIDAWLERHNQTRYTGISELWMDELGNEVLQEDCSLSVDGNTLHYQWCFKGETKQGSITIQAAHALWCDTFHQPSEVSCHYNEAYWGLLSVSYQYPAPPGPDWGWRIMMSIRPDDTLVVQMTNIAPWGEEARAVRFTMGLVEP